MFRETRRRPPRPGQAEEAHVTMPGYPAGRAEVATSRQTIDHSNGTVATDRAEGGLFMSVRSRRCTVLEPAPLVVVFGILISHLGCDSGPQAPSTPGKAVTATTTSSAKTDPVASKPVSVQPQLIGDRLAGTTKEPVALSKQKEPSPFRFAEIAREAGIDFVNFSGMTTDKHFPTANGSGLALFDYDNDGLLDIYFATCTLLPIGTAEKGPNRLYRNLGGNKFEDATDKAGLGYRGFCHGIVVGDIDNDGDQDVFLCNYGPNVLYLNNGDGTFKDVSKAAGIDKPNWSSGGAFLDYDNDGDLDLYISNYGEWIYPDDDQFCGDPEKKIRLYCSPRTIRTVKHLFYRNNGDGTFTDVYDKVIKTIDPETKQIKPRSDGHGFGVVAADLNDDGKVDIYVANDMNPNFLFLNNGDGTFEDATEISGAAFDEKGQAQSGMGVDAEDINGDGLPELFVTNFQNEYNTIYQNYGKGTFLDSTPFLGMAADTTPWVSWGTALVDLDNDGWPDNFTTTGHVDDNREGTDYPEPALLFYNLKGRKFRLATREAGKYFDEKHVGRGAAFGDIDNDGDIDIVINHKDSPPAVLRNDTPTDNHWIRLELQGTRSNRDAVGAKIVVDAGGLVIHRQRKGGVSMESANDPRVTIGVGSAEQIVKLTVRWPSGTVTTLENVKTGEPLKLVEPAGEKAANR